jgi:CRP-like cAMP-binding protein
MLSTLEKVLILKGVPVFSQTPDHVLAEVAGLLEQVDVSADETVFRQGEAGDSLYVILDGRVRVHNGDQLLNYLGEREVFGEMALLDPEPRSASVTAVEPTRLFRLDQAPFYQLMEERPEVATGIIHVLSGHLRNRVRDIAHLHARIQALEHGRDLPPDPGPL